MRFPDFICIGAQKAGTTWLHEQLGDHPDVWLPPLKELHYFNIVHLNYAKHPDTGLTAMDQNRIDRTLRMIEWTLRGQRSPLEKLEKIRALSLIGLREHSDEWYAAIFASAPLASKCGEITPDYALLPDKGIEHILRLQPQMKFIFILRDPIDRGWSDIRMMQRKTNSAGQNELRRIAGKEFFERADYFSTIKRFRQFVRPENFLVLYFDDLVETPRKMLQNVCELIGVSFDRAKFRKVHQPIHQGQDVELPLELYEALKERLKPAYERLLALNEAVIEKWYHRHYAARK